MDLSSIAAQRLYNQQITQPQASTGRPYTTPAQVVAWMGAMQAQDFAAAKWALGLRLPPTSERAVEAAFNAGAILRTHVMRPTWHFVAPQDIRWLLELTAPRVHAVNAYMYRKMELDDELFQRSSRAMALALRDGQQLTRVELGKVLEREGIPALNIRLGYLVHRAELDGILCSGARRGKQFTYALLDLRAPQAISLPREEALGELTRRYFTSHGPATAADFAWWSGLSTADVREGLRLAGSALRRETLDGREHWLAADSPTPPDPGANVHLLPAYDEYTIAYKNHAAILAPELLDLDKAAVYSGTIAIGGKLAGNWRRVLRNRQVVVETAPFRPLTGAELDGFRDAAQRYADFVELPLAIE